jgi:putative phosphoesterase
MLVGIFADTHDHLANIRRAVERFNAAGCELVLFAGDLVSTFAVPPLRKLKCPFVGCFGDNEGNKIGLMSGYASVGQMGEPPVRHTTADGTRFIVCHMQRQLRGQADDWDIAIFGHTHKPRITRDELDRLLINPGETSGWTFGRATIVLLDTGTQKTDVIDLEDSLTTNAAASGGRKTPGHSKTPRG